MVTHKKRQGWSDHFAYVTSYHLPPHPCLSAHFEVSSKPGSRDEAIGIAQAKMNNRHELGRCGRRRSLGCIDRIGSFGIKVGWQEGAQPHSTRKDSR